MLVRLVEDAVDQPLDQVTQMGVPADDVVPVRLDSVRRSVEQTAARQRGVAELLSQGGADAVERPAPRYAVGMAMAE